MRRAAVLLSGGLDSATAAAWAHGAGFEVTALSVDYGQRQAVELEAARRVAASLGITDHRMVRVDLRAIGGSALTSDLAVPKNRAEIGEDVPITYVPARNTVFLALLTGLAEVVGARHLVIGVNAQDYSGYPDCQPQFLHAFAEVARLGTRVGAEGGRFEIHAPLLHLSKAGIVRLGFALGLEHALTLSCYDPPAPFVHCGACDACRLRRAGFAEAGVADPTAYLR
ncbi:MAG: 7-cyano-7-deazaguanine synthase QueC [Thermoanaerobaculaceae bacterium]|nr:7-cyano-7-deazaguanine synthase QueC [Thermoanaerobaculaceae bacterium]MDI9620939.1 7-cyano-7-deazaguanine synthase QueC [Acidobacteriota bacterium]NLH10578.1 7-cyano-7-deazaguanine synthase QueC [Holophagae bacterium]HPW56669.1 7-cyano-7-deazaguanine synthase QueC [Thermoanaerobaculaceae bacterium]